MEWNAFYCFPEVEFLPEDFEIMNHFVGTHPSSFQTRMVLVVKFLRRAAGEGEDGEGDQEEVIYGKKMVVDGVVKENLGGKTSVVKVCESESERVRVLKEVFGILLTEEQRDGIRGRVAELKGV